MRSLSVVPLVLLLALVSACSTPEQVPETTAHDGPRKGETALAEPDVVSTDVAPTAVAVVEPLPPILVTPGGDAAPVALATLARWFEGPPLASAVALWTSGERAASVAALDQFVKTYPDDARVLPARFLAAWILADGEPEPHVAERFEALASDWPLMADACSYYAARAHVAEVELDPALALLAKIPQGSIHWGRAQALVAQALADEGRSKDARQVLEAAVKAAPGALPGDGWARLAELREGDGDAKGALRSRLELARREPASELGKKALQALTLTQLSSSERVRLGSALIDAGRSDAARAVVAGIISPKADACAAWVLLGRAWDRKKKDKAAPKNAWKWYEKALACEGDARADATFLGGRNRMRNDDAKQGLKLLEAHVAEFPKRSTADDALLMIANAKKRPKDADKALVKTLTRYPAGDQADDVAWALVQKPLEKREWKGVLAAVDKVMQATLDAPFSRHGGRYQYWKARALWELGKKDEARALWRDLVTKHPLTWYALLGYARLASEDEAAAKRLVLDHAPASEPDTTLAPQALWADVHFRRAIEWARLAGPANPTDSGASPFDDFIAAELDAVPDTLRDADWKWRTAEIYTLAGDYPQAMRLARALEYAGGLGWPTPHSPAARLWALAYPQPFPALVAQWSKERAIDPYWVWSIARVESNFDATAISFANAIGLMQIIPSTAKMLAKDTTIDPTRENLCRPDVAIELGTKYLARLLRKHVTYPLASAGYNAGGGAVSKWRNQFGDLELDEFVERIPYREANNYAKSVTQTVARYQWLYGNTPLRLDLSAPGVPSDPTPTEDPVSTTSEAPADTTPADDGGAPAGEGTPAPSVPPE